MSVTRRSLAHVLIAFSTALVVSACTSSGGGRTPASSSPSESPASPSVVATSTSTSTSTSSPPPTPSSSPVPPEAATAKTAYVRYAVETYNAERTPATDHSGQLSTLAIDPALGTFQGLLTQLQIAGIANRGEPPTSRVKIRKVDLTAKPYPTVTVVDCPTVSPTWMAYDIKTGKPVKVVANPVGPPYAITGTVVRYKAKWVVYRTTVDGKRTCTP